MPLREGIPIRATFIKFYTNTDYLVFLRDSLGRLLKCYIIKDYNEAKEITKLKRKYEGIIIV